MLNYMEKQITRRSFLRKTALGAASACVVPVAASKLVKAIGSTESTGKSKAGTSNQNTNKNSERLEWAEAVWKNPLGQMNLVRVEGWNNSGKWSYFCKIDTREIIAVSHIDYEGHPFMLREGKCRTIQELRAEGMSWENIQKTYCRTIQELRAEGMSWEKIDRIYSEGRALCSKNRPEFAYGRDASNRV